MSHIHTEVVTVQRNMVMTNFSMSRANKCLPALPVYPASFLIGLPLGITVYGILKKGLVVSSKSLNRSVDAFILTLLKKKS